MFEGKRVLQSSILCAVFVIASFACLATPASAATGSVFFQNASGVSVENYIPPTTMYIRLIGSGGDYYGSCFLYTLMDPSGQTVDSEEYAVLSLYTTETYSLSTSSPTGNWRATLRFWDDYSGRFYTLAADIVYVGPTVLPNVVANTPGASPSPAINTHAITIGYSISTTSVAFTQTVTTQLLVDNVVVQTQVLYGSSGAATYSYSYSTTAHYGMVVKVITDVYGTVSEMFENDNEKTVYPTVIAEGTVSISGDSYPVPGTMSISVTRYHGDVAEGKFRLWLRDSAGSVRLSQDWLDTQGSSVVNYNLVVGDPGGYWEATLYWYCFADGSTYKLSSDRTWVEGITILNPRGYVSIPLSSYSYPSTISTHVEGWDGDGTEGKFVFNLKDPSGAVKKTQQWTSSSTDYAFSTSVDYTLLATSPVGLWTGELVWYRYSTGKSYQLGSDVAEVAYSGVPTLTYPTNGATLILTPTTLTWSAPTGANYYEISISTGTGAVYYHSTTTSTTLSLSSYTTYYWQVRASPNSGVTYGPWTETWSFKTKTAAGVGGFVTDSKDGTPIGGATVWIQGTTSSTVSDLTGRYWIPWTTAGTYTVWASKNGFTDKSGSFTSTGSSTHTIGLSMTHTAGFYGWVRNMVYESEAGINVDYWYESVLVRTGQVIYKHVYAITDEWGYYTIASGDLSSRKTYSSSAFSADSWKSTREGCYWKTGYIVKQDFYYIPDITGQVPVAKIFMTTDDPDIHTELYVTYGSGATQTLTISAAGNSYTYSEAISVAWSYPAPLDSKSLVLTRDVVYTGTYDMTNLEIAEVRVRAWTSNIHADFSETENPTSISDPYYDGIDTSVIGLGSNKGGSFDPVPGGMILYTSDPVQVGVTQSSSTVLEGGLEYSIGIGPISFSVKVTIAVSSSSTNTMSCKLYNCGGDDHVVKWYVEGADLYGGISLHIWDMGVT